MSVFKEDSAPAFVLVLLVVLLGACANPEPSPYLPGARGDYLGEIPPAREMKVFAPGLITFGTHEHHLVMTPDGQEIFYVIADRYRQHHTIIQVRREGDNWRRPEVASFSGEYNDFAPTPHPDGTALLLCSNRPLPGEPGEPGDVNIWSVKRTPDGWGEPLPLPGRVNDDSGEYNPTLAADGTLYFQDHDGTSVEIFRAVPVDGSYPVPEKVEVINTPYPEIGPLVTPDGGTLIFSSSRPGGEGDLDFWVSFLGNDGRWGEPNNLGPSINTPSADAIITLSPDGKYLFFTHFMALDPDRLKRQPYEELVRLLGGPENGDGTVYWISSEILNGDGHRPVPRS